ncbi:MAG: NUDIX hydrolase [Pseudomonadota bacterium]
MDRKVKVKGKDRLSDGFLKIDKATVEYETFSGGTRTAQVESLERGDSVAAVILDRSCDELIFVEQFRYPTLAHGPGWIEELVAGGVKAGEEPGKALEREVLEEIGFEVESLEGIGTFYVSPGGSSERIMLYFATVSAQSRCNDGGGRDDEGEDIRLVRLPANDLASALEAKRFVDAKTLIGLMWFQNRKP